MKTMPPWVSYSKRSGQIIFAASAVVGCLAYSLQMQTLLLWCFLLAFFGVQGWEAGKLVEYAHGGKRPGSPWLSYAIYALFALTVLERPEALPDGASKPLYLVLFIGLGVLWNRAGMDALATDLAAPSFTFTHVSTDSLSLVKGKLKVEPKLNPAMYFCSEDRGVRLTLGMTERGDICLTPEVENSCIALADWYGHKRVEFGVDDACGAFVRLYDFAGKVVWTTPKEHA
jgi:hypothetical protein